VLVLDVVVVYVVDDDVTAAWALIVRKKARLIYAHFLPLSLTRCVVLPLHVAGDAASVARCYDLNRPGYV